jgi:hypothetical protein
MALMKIVTKPDSRPVSQQEIVAELSRKTSNVWQYDRQDLLAKQIGAEPASGDLPSGWLPDPARVEARAQHLLQLESYPAFPSSGLMSVLTERAAVARAVEILQSDSLRAAALATVEYMGAGGEDRWLQNRQNLAAAILSVVKYCEEGIAMRQAGAEACGGSLALPHIERMALLTAEARLIAERILGRGLPREPYFQ